MCAIVSVADDLDIYLSANGEIGKERNSQEDKDDQQRNDEPKYSQHPDQSREIEKSLS